MSAESLFSIVAPAPAPVTASKAVGAHGDSSFDRVLGEAMDSSAEQAGTSGKNDKPLTPAGATSPRSSPGAMAATAITSADDTVVEAAEEAAQETTAPAATRTSEAALPPPTGAGLKLTDDAQLLPAAPTDKGTEVAQVLPGPQPVVVAATPGEVPADRSQADGKGVAGPLVQPDPVDTGPAPEPAVSAKGTEVPQVLPGLSAKTGGPQVLPGVVTGPVAGKPADPQILPVTNSDPRTGTAAEPSTPVVSAAGTKAAAATMAALAPAVTPPPARPLTDRTGTVSNSVRATGDKTSNPGSSSSSGFTATIVPATVAAAPSASGTLTAPEATSLSDRPLTQGNAAPVPPVATAPDVTVKSPVDQPSVEAQPAPVTQAGTASQTYSLSNLSNAAVEATAQLAAQIIRRMDARSTRFEMALTPDHLGRVDVSLDIDESGRLAARLAFDNPAAALDMKGRVDDLRRQLEEAGFHLADDAFQFAERDRSSGEAFDRRQGRAFAAASRLSDETDAAADVTAPRWMSLSLTPDRVDMKV